jgi:hypothetical protein
MIQDSHLSFSECRLYWHGNRSMNLIELGCYGWTAMSIEIAGQGLRVKLAARNTKLLSEVLSSFKDRVWQRDCNFHEPQGITGV